jgi:hypothetical protein
VHRWLFAALSAALLLATGSPTYAQTPVGQSNCQQLIWQNVAPALMQGNQFTPGGMFPVGYAPLMQPFGINPNEPAYSAYATTAYYSSYAVPGWAQRNPGQYPAAWPGSGALPGLYPPDLTATLGTDPNPALTSGGILGRMQSDGTWDRLSPTEQADWMFRLASLQRDEINQRFTQASLQQNAENTMLNLRQAPIQLALTAQDRSRNGRDSMSLYAATLQILVNSSCNTTTAECPA